VSDPPSHQAGHSPTGRVQLSDFGGDRQLYRILIDHAYRGVWVQLALRAALASFVLITILVEPPVHDQDACLAVACVYAVVAALIAGWTTRGGARPVQQIWLALFIDLAALATVTILASRSDAQSWTADILVNGFFVLPMLAATQLRPGISAVIAGPTVVVYLTTSIFARHANGEPWQSIVLRTAVLTALSGACVLMSWVARSRVMTIIGLVSDRRGLVGELAEVEVRARRDLADELHDGALQYLLAARHDIEDARATGDPESFDRVGAALQESTTLLRAKVGQLHPAVLQQAGLLRALEDLAGTIGERTGLEIRFSAQGWDADLRTTNDDFLYGAARELLTNVVKHARATSVQIVLTRDAASDRLVVTDDGVGIEPGVLDRRLGEGHIGLASQRVRVEAAGGYLRLRAADPGTAVEVTLPHATAPAA
jgi:two-component system, NarL family, sensor kinase